MQSKLLSQLRQMNDILIVGGGSGKILEQAIQLGISRRYVYAELSEKMIARTKARMKKHTFAEIEYSTNFRSNLESRNFDCVILPFVLDCYSHSSIDIIIKSIKSGLNDKGLIIFIDFQHLSNTSASNVLKNLFIKLLYQFFRITAQIEANGLANFDSIFLQNGFKPTYRLNRCNGWIQGTIWKLPSAIFKTA